MRVCLFSASLESLTSGDWTGGLRPMFGGGDLEVVGLTPSWADVPPDPGVHATGGGRKWSMRALRRAAAAGPMAARLAGRALKPFVVEDLLEGLRAADPDIIICDTPSTTAQVRAVLSGTTAPWPCISVGDSVPPIDRSFRRYDPAATVSIVLPTFQGVRYLRESIVSCLTQTHRNLELIVVDDGSTAPVEEIVRECADSRVRFIRHQQNQGLPASLNTGFRASTGQFCTWTSDDNAYLPEAIREMLAFLQTYDVEFVYAESFRIDETGVSDPGAVIKPRPAETLATDNYIGACFLYSRQVYRAIGDYDCGAVLAEDYDYWVRVSQQFTMQRLFKPLYRYRFHSSSLTAHFRRAEVERQVQRVRARHGSRRSPRAASAPAAPRSSPRAAQ